jgi:hypothetical protein
MLIEFDQSTMANMTAALEYVCNQLPPENESYRIRKRIADSIVACARAGSRTLDDFQDAGLAVLADVTRPTGFDWFGLRRSRR